MEKLKKKRKKIGFFLKWRRVYLDTFFLLAHDEDVSPSSTSVTISFRYNWRVTRSLLIFSSHNSSYRLETFLSSSNLQKYNLYKTISNHKIQMVLDKKIQIIFLAHIYMYYNIMPLLARGLRKEASVIISLREAYVSTSLISSIFI